MTPKNPQLRTSHIGKALLQNDIHYTSLSGTTTNHFYETIMTCCFALELQRVLNHLLSTLLNKSTSLKHFCYLNQKGKLISNMTVTNLLALLSADAVYNTNTKIDLKKFQI